MPTDYTPLITGQHRDKPRFVELVELLTGAAGSIADAIAGFPAVFDVDLAVGVQLDATGRWVGIGRSLPVPLTGVYFSLDIEGVGFDEGYLLGEFDPVEGLVDLPDEEYRAVLRAAIASNYWDGTNEALWALSSTVLLDQGIDPLVIDHFDMSFTVLLKPPAPSPIYLQLVKNSFLPPKPAGVRLNEVLLLSDTDPAFALDYDTASLAGFDEGALPVIL